eukprot:TRINITY_DN81374_c0_g1_i1.p1 TRINITY_DN81374_c0_g1~~TRINITY_DN81374_c0_g1_i1.p1  ORF type:complete len:1400 (-),score=286.43 TRINITY_DN81374_c0_g1_i1:15-4214(-)
MSTRWTKTACFVSFLMAIARADAEGDGSSSGSSDLCIQGGVPPEHRRNIFINDIEMPLGILSLTFGASPQVSAHVYRIIAAEMLGYNATISGEAPTSGKGMSMVIGCGGDTTSDCGKPRGSLPPVSQQRHHALLEVWTSVTDAYLAELAEAALPEDVGALGYKGFESMYVFEKIRRQGYHDSMRSVLEHYRTYNASMGAMEVYFDKPSALPADWLLPCEQTRLGQSVYMSDYLAVTGDEDGVDRSTGTVLGRCWNGRWWYAPTCRNDPDRCIPVVTGGSGWAMDAFMQKATAFDMPLAITVASNFSNYLDLPRMADVMLYWWEPDVAFVDLQPWPVVFPMHDSNKWSLGDKRTDTMPVDLRKYAHPQLKTNAWQAYTLLERMKIWQPQIDALMLEKRETGLPEADIACRWVRANTERWKDWLLDDRLCRVGQGLVDGDPIFVDDFARAVACAKCPPGMVSKGLKLEANAAKTAEDQVTHVCVPCPRGSFTNAWMSDECHSCEAGKYTSSEGMSECTLCEIGRYQPAAGTSECIRCNETYTTQFFGARDLSSCVCPRDYYFDWMEDRACRPCADRATIGLTCPGGHSVTDRAVDTTPVIEPGFMSLPEDPLNIYSCAYGKEQCKTARSTANMSGMCPENFDPSMPQCATCEQGYFLVPGGGGNCKKCDDKDTGGWLFVKLMLSQLLQVGVLLYLLVRSNRPNPMGMISVTLLVSYLQVIQQLSQLPLLWPKPLEYVFSHLEVFTVQGAFSMMHLRPQCAFGGSFIWRVFTESLTPGTPIAHMGIIYMVARIFAKPVILDHAINTLALVYKGVFVTICSMALAIFVPDIMPGGVAMVKLLPGLVMDSAEWLQAVPLALCGFCLYCVTFVAWTAQAVWMAPKWVAKWSGFSARYRFAFGALRPDRWWWVLVRISYSLGLTVCQIWSRTVHLRIYSVTFLLLIYAVMCFHLQPFKFRKNNLVDLGLQGSLLFFLLIATSFIDTSRIDAKQLETTRHDFAILAIVLLAIGAAHSCQGFASWLYSLYHPKATQLGKMQALANQFRDVMVAVLMLPDDVYHRAIFTLGEMDQLRLEAVLETLVPVFLKKQPNKNFFDQRLVPSAPFELWDAGRTSMEVLKGSADGAFDRQVAASARQRLRLLQLARDVTCSGVPSGYLRQSSTRKSLRDFGLEKPVETILTHARTAASGNGTISVTPDEFVDMHGPITQLSDEDLLELFKYMDYDNSGTLSFDELAGALISVKPLLTAYNTHIAPISTELQRTASRRLTRVEDDYGGGGGGSTSPMSTLSIDIVTSKQTSNKALSLHGVETDPRSNRGGDGIEQQGRMLGIVPTSGGTLGHGEAAAKTEAGCMPLDEDTRLLPFAVSSEAEEKESDGSASIADQPVRFRDVEQGTASHPRTGWAAP